MRPIRRILLIVYDGCELLDLAGPSSVFAAANTLSGRALYEVHALGETAGVVQTGVGIPIIARNRGNVRVGARDTVLVLGAEAAPLRAACRDAALLKWLATRARHAERLGSVCTGTFVLAAAGVLGGRRVTTHWAACDELATRFPDLIVDRDAISVSDDGVWTSAGVTTGIDLALSMLRADHGAELMAAVARHLVVYAHRYGGQSQFSRALEAQVAAGGDFSALVAFMLERLDQPLTLDDMAEHVHMSPRTLLRRFERAMQCSPSRFLDALRMDEARRLLEHGDSVKHITRVIGYRSEAAFRTAFTQRFGMTPSHYAALHAVPNADTPTDTPRQFSDPSAPHRAAGGGFPSPESPHR